MKRADLIIDVGMHLGEDSEFYLAKGFSVVAIEADPILVAQTRTRLDAHIRAGRLQIFEGAIAPTADPQRLTVFDDHRVWNSLSPEFVARNRAVGASGRDITVAGLRFEDVLAQVGIPHYLKIDIGGNDMLCIAALGAFAERPDYLSIESSVSVMDAPFARVFDELAQLWTLGYRAFKYLDQTGGRRNPPTAAQPSSTSGNGPGARDASGPFAEETPGKWLPIERTLLRAECLRWHQRLAGNGGRWSRSLPSRAYLRARSRLVRHYPSGWYPMGWYDLHARLRPVDRGGQ